MVSIGERWTDQIFAFSQTGMILFGCQKPGVMYAGKKKKDRTYLSTTWRIIRVSKWLITMVIVSHLRIGLFRKPSIHGLYKWLINEGFLRSPLNHPLGSHPPSMDGSPSLSSESESRSLKVVALRLGRRSESFGSEIIFF